MRRWLVALASLAGLSAALVLGHCALIETGREVIVLRTEEPGGGWLESRLWIVDDGAVSWLHGGDSRWMRNLTARPTVEIVRGGETHRYRATPVPGPHPYKARYRHQYWFIDGRRLDVAIGGVHGWSLIILEGYSRTMLSGAMAPTEATWAALMGLYTDCLRYGAPAYLVSDRGGAYTSNDFETVCTRLQVRHETIVST